MRCVNTGSRSVNDSRARSKRLLAAGKNLYLAGFMATGKTATAKAIARLLRVPWTDLDERIERESGLTVEKFFAERGERAFRAAEHDALKAVTGAGGLVVALGGGTVCHARNRALLRGTGPIVLLTAPAEVVLRRIGRTRTRPLLADQDAHQRIRALLVRRASDYSRYRLRVDTTDLTASAAAGAVLQVIEDAGRRSEAARARDMAGCRGGTCR